MKQPTIIKIGAVIAGKSAIAWTTGKKNIDKPNNIATTTEVNPVLPPAATPEVDSTYAVAGLVPNIEPTVVAVASANKAGFTRGNLPFFINPPCSATPIIVPVVSKIVTSKNANTTVYNPWEKTPLISMSKKTGAGGVEIIPENVRFFVRNPIIPVIIIPINNAPFIRRAIKINVINKPTNVRTVIGSCKSPRVTKFSSSATIIPDILRPRSEEHTSELQSRGHLVCRLLLEKKKIKK